MKKLVILITLAIFASLTPLASASAADEIRVTDFVTGVGLGCYGRCGYLSVTFKVKNIDYDKSVSIFFKGEDGEWRELAAYYSRPLEYGFEEWRISTNFGSRGGSIEFVAKYEVDGEVYWDNNFKHNFSGVLL
ncbi:MAG: hypothetical protein KAG61_11615 [Bacteriovoracaceae bacterium]|nr:hypothetical protein [Bacteriovoracaceae bacterium]